MKAFLNCALCNESVECDAKKSVFECAQKNEFSEVKIIDLNTKEENSFFVCKHCALALANLEKKEIKQVKKRSFSHTYVPMSFKKFALIKLE